MKEKVKEKLTVNPWRIFKIFLIAFLVFEVIFYFSFQGANGKLWPLDNSFYYYTPLLFVATAIFAAISVTQTYYTIDGATFSHYKMGKVIDYTFNNIIFIDEEFSEQKKMMRFFTRDGREHLLIFDKNRILYQTALKKCPLISKEDFIRRYPNVKM